MQRTENSEVCQIELPYGASHIRIDVPARNLLAIASPKDTAPAEDLDLLVRKALRAPLGMPAFADLLGAGQRLVILIDDLTRPTPVRQILPILLDELQVESKRADVTILIALGTHRNMTRAEIEERVGPDLARRYRIVNHEWEDGRALVDLGRTPNGTPIWVNRLVQEADVVVGLGNIVPHNIAGWSGGGKILQPGVCGKETTYGTHLLAARCPSTNFGKPFNPVRIEIEEVAQRTNLTGVVNTVLNRHNEVMHVVAGRSRATYERGVQLAREIWEVPVPALADIVIASSHPADVDFWQANKGLYASERIVKRGGDIILVTPCPERLSSQREHVAALEALLGIPSRELYWAARQKGIVDYAALTVSDIAARCRELAWVTVVSDGLTADDVSVMGLERALSPNDALQRALARQGPDASIVILTHGGETLPVVV